MLAIEILEVVTTAGGGVVSTETTELVVAAAGGGATTAVVDRTSELVVLVLVDVEEEEEELLELELVLVDVLVEVLLLLLVSSELTARASLEMAEWHCAVVFQVRKFTVLMCLLLVKLTVLGITVAHTKRATPIVRRLGAVVLLIIAAPPRRVRETRESIAANRERPLRIARLGNLQVILSAIRLSFFGQSHSIFSRLGNFSFFILLLLLTFFSQVIIRGKLKLNPQHQP